MVESCLRDQYCLLVSGSELLTRLTLSHWLHTFAFFCVTTEGHATAQTHPRDVANHKAINGLCVDPTSHHQLASYTEVCTLPSCLLLLFLTLLFLSSLLPHPLLVYCSSLPPPPPLLLFSSSSPLLLLLPSPPPPLSFPPPSSSSSPLIPSQYTCIAASPHYVALGANTGGVYCFHRDSLRYIRILSNKARSHTCTHSHTVLLTMGGVIM